MVTIYHAAASVVKPPALYVVQPQSYPFATQQPGLCDVADAILVTRFSVHHISRAQVLSLP